MTISSYISLFLKSNYYNDKIKSTSETTCLKFYRTGSNYSVLSEILAEKETMKTRYKKNLAVIFGSLANILSIQIKSVGWGQFLFLLLLGVKILMWVSPLSYHMI